MLFFISHPPKESEQDFLPERGESVEIDLIYLALKSRKGNKISKIASMDLFVEQMRK